MEIVIHTNKFCIRWLVTHLLLRILDWYTFGTHDLFIEILHIFAKLLELSLNFTVLLELRLFAAHPLVKRGGHDYF